MHVGLCTGLLPAAAAAVATDTSQLLLYGLDVVSISISLTLDIILISKRVYTEPGSLSYTVVGIKNEQAQAILDDYNHAQAIKVPNSFTRPLADMKQNLPSHKYAYISAFSSTWCTISGPPSVLKRLWSSSPPIGQAPRIELPADAAVHSTHLPGLDTDMILSSSAMFLTTPISATVRILSPCDGEPYKFSNVGDLLHAMIQDISQNPMDLLQTFQKCAGGFRGVKNVELMVIGPTAHASSVQAALEENKLDVKVTNTRENLVSHVPTRDGSGLVAVVGMSGRFPGSESIQAFWESLQLGQDFHREVSKLRSAPYQPSFHIDSSLDTQIKI